MTNPSWHQKHWGSVLSTPIGDIVAQVHRYGTAARATIWPGRDLGVFDSEAEARAAVDRKLAEEA